MTERRVLLGVIGRPHGVRGLVHVQSYTADPAALAAYGPLTDEAGRRYTLSWRGAGIAEITELDAEGHPERDAGEPRRVADRTAAQRLTNRRLYIDRAALPPPAADEFYLADLIGLEALGPGGALGEVVAVHEYGAGTSLEIARPGAPPLLVPFTRAAVPEVDLAHRRVRVCPPAETMAR